MLFKELWMDGQMDDRQRVITIVPLEPLAQVS